MAYRREPSLQSQLPISSGTDRASSTVGVKDVFLGVPEMGDSFLPDLGFSNEPTNEDVINQNLDVAVEPTQDVPSTEDEQDAVDTLLSLSNVCDIPSNANIDTELGLDDNALLVIIGSVKT